MEIPTAFRVNTDSADRAFERVLACAGALPWQRDAVDRRIVAGVKEQNGRIIFSQSEVGGWPELKSAAAPADTDKDGIPDDWELAHGLNPKDPSDSAKPAKDGRGYSNLELYINSLAVPCK